MLYTIGYQNKDINFFIKALRAFEIGIIIDVRSKPTGWNLAFRQKALENRMTGEGIAYYWWGEWLEVLGR